MTEWKNPICWSCKYYTRADGCIVFSDFDLTEEEREKEEEEQYYAAPTESDAIFETNEHDVVFEDQTFAVTYTPVEGVSKEQINSGAIIDYYKIFKQAPVFFSDFSKEFREELEKKRMRPKNSRENKQG